MGDPVVFTATMPTGDCIETQTVAVEFSMISTRDANKAFHADTETTRTVPPPSFESRTHIEHGEKKTSTQSDP
jgi:hypothetical protein